MHYHNGKTLKHSAAKKCIRDFETQSLMHRDL